MKRNNRFLALGLTAAVAATSLAGSVVLHPPIDIIS